MTDRNRADRATVDLRKLSLEGQKTGWLPEATARALDIHINEVERILQVVPVACDSTTSQADLDPVFE